MPVFGIVNRAVAEDSARTTLAAIGAFLLARLFHMPEAYWATISTITVMQSTLGAELTISWQRFVGTVLGAASAGLLATYFPYNLPVFGLGLFLLGLLCAVLRIATAYRFAGLTLAIVMLIVREKPAWAVAEHRFIEVSIGIFVALVTTALWPLDEKQNITSVSMAHDNPRQ